jgi:type I restriction enzyme M protein
MRGPCSALRVATIRCGDYPSVSLRAGSEQLTYLLFGYGITSRSARYEPAPQQAETSACCLKMADERSRPPYNQASPVLAGYDWKRLAPSLALPRKRERGFSWGDELFDHYRHTLEELGKQKGLLGLIFSKSHGGIRS